MKQMKDQKAGLLHGQVAIVTGGTVGIGRATCLAIAKEGANVVVVGRSRERLDETLVELNRQGKASKYLGLALDVRSEADMAEMAATTLKQFSRIDILVTCAGILRLSAGVLRTLQQMPVEEWDEVIDINLKGVFLANRAVMPAMIRQRRGDVVNISSTSGRKGLAYDTAYCASKFGIIGLSESLAAEVGQYGIRVQVLLPGAIETGMWDQNGPLPPPKERVSAEGVAGLILYLITLPKDAVLDAPIIEPFNKQLRTGWVGRSVV